jgi:serine/threonine-protein kinase
VRAYLSPAPFSSTSDHHFVQRRIALTYGLLAVLLAALFVVYTGFIAVLLPLEEVLFIDTAELTYLGSVAVLGVGWLICRRKLLPPAALGLVDGICLVAVTALLAVTAFDAPPALRVEHVGVTPFGLVVAVRAALVPAPPWWTVAVSTIAGMPLPVLAFALMLEGRGVTAPFPGVVGIMVVSLWGMAAIVAAWAISRVVYGLRVQVKSAMQFGQYTLEEKIGEGGMGVVYRARHAMLRRPTALKLLPTSRADSIGPRRFEREVQLTSRLTHPNTIAIYDYGHTQNGVFYYAMELLDGFTLAELCHEDGPQPAGRVIHILSQAAQVLAEAHSIGLIHRDVKPANIFLCVHGGIHDFVKVLDFGLVKELSARDPSLSSPGLVAGTPLYMAPEAIAEPEAVDARVDIYALGAVGYFLITGQAPFTRKSPVELYHAHMYEHAPLPSERLGKPVPDDLERLLMDCLAKSPDDRPATASELVDRLDALRPLHPWTENDARSWWMAHRPAGPKSRDAVIGDPQLTDPLGETLEPTETLMVKLEPP